MALYKMNIHEKYLKSIREHKKTHEYRLNTKERQKINVNDSILLTSVEDKSDSLEVTVTKKTLYRCWEVAILKNWRNDFSDTFHSFSKTLKELKTYYSADDVNKYGIVMFDIKLTKK